MVVPYPPGIPVVMPGEKFGPETQRILEYLAYCEDFDTRFPGFENEVHGVMVEQRKILRILHQVMICLKG